MENQQNFIDSYKIINDETFKLSIATVNAKLNSFGINSVFIIGSIMLISAFVMAYQLPMIRTKTDKRLPKGIRSISNLKKLIEMTFDEAGKTYKFIKLIIVVLKPIFLYNLFLQSLTYSIFSILSFIL